MWIHAWEFAQQLLQKIIYSLGFQGEPIKLLNTNNLSDNFLFADCLRADHFSPVQNFFFFPTKNVLKVSLVLSAVARSVHYL